MDITIGGMPFIKKQASVLWRELALSLGETVRDFSQENFLEMEALEQGRVMA